MKKNIVFSAISAVYWLGSVFGNIAYSSPQIPKLKNVFLIVMENHVYGQIIGNPDAPFINQLAQSANIANNYFAVGLPSLPNYLELIGGSNFGVQNDNYPDWHNVSSSSSLINPIQGAGTDAETPASTAPFNKKIPAAPFIAKTIADQLVETKRSWKSYQENLPASGADGVNFSDGDFSNLSSSVNTESIQKLYAVKHNPFAYFASIQGNQNPKNSLSNIAGFDGLNGLYADLRSGKVPNLSFIVPDLCHDMHGASGGSVFCTDDFALVTLGDATVQRVVTAIKSSKAWKRGKNAIVLTWDEGGGTLPNRVVAIVDTNYGKHGLSSNAPYSHFSLLKTLEAAFNLPCLNHACDSDVNVMSDMFQKAR